MSIVEMDSTEHISILHMMYAICFTHVGMFSSRVLFILFIL